MSKQHPDRVLAIAFNTLIASYMNEDGLDRRAACVKAAKMRPDAHRAWVRTANRRAGRAKAASTIPA